MHFRNRLKKQISIAGLILALLFGMAGCGSPDPGTIDQELAEQNLEQNQEQSPSDNLSDGQEQGNFSDAKVDGNLTVRFLDVGQGNSVLVECDGKYMLIDGGDYDYSSYVVAYLKNLGVQTLDYMIVSHYDSDHLSGCVGALRAFDVDTVICPDYEGDTKTYYTFAEDVKTYANEYIHPQVGDTYTMGDAMFTIVCPERTNHSDENDNSVGVRLSYGNNSFLICGDAGEETEEEMIKSGEQLKSDVYLASHHGSGGSSIYDFLQEVQPEVVVISCGYDNSYGHPAKATMNRLQKTGADLYRTDLQGELVAVSDGTTITWNVKPCNDFCCGEDVVAAGTVDKPASNSGSSNSSTNNNNSINSGANSSSSSNNSGSSTNKTTYILNTNSGKFHIPTCDSVLDMSDSNKKEVNSTISEMESKGYSPCKRCLD